MKHSHSNIFIDEIIIHWKFTLSAVILSAALIFIWKHFLNRLNHYGETLFEFFFISHLFFASLTPAALLSKYRRVFWLGLTVAIVSSSVTCTLSDIILPYLGALLLGYNMSLHICIIEEPLISVIFIISGALTGYILSMKIIKLSRYTHAAHILLSSFAAGMYLITYGAGDLSLISLVFIPVITLSVLLPCVANDIAVPSYFVSLNLQNNAERQNLTDDIHGEHHNHHH
ncbi:MAG: hypothetical protein N2510_02570 [Ignavibacteria bacterium]|nr:hypothetical protein [Ignavibacteria bacterium]